MRHFNTKISAVVNSLHNNKLPDIVSGRRVLAGEDCTLFWPCADWYITFSTGSARPEINNKKKHFCHGTFIFWLLYIFNVNQYDDCNISHAINVDILMCRNWKIFCLIVYSYRQKSWLYKLKFSISILRGTLFDLLEF